MNTDTNEHQRTIFLTAAAERDAALVKRALAAGLKPGPVAMAHGYKEWQTPEGDAVVLRDKVSTVWRTGSGGQWSLPMTWEEALTMYLNHAGAP